MSDIKNESYAVEEITKAKRELTKKIEEFMELSEAEEEENIVEWVYYFFQPYGTEVALSVYPNAAAVVLSIFAGDPKLSKKMEGIFGDSFYFLVEMLEKIVEFCGRIKENETNMARLDLCKFTGGNCADLNMKDILKTKIKYKHKIECLKEITSMERQANSY